MIRSATRRLVTAAGALAVLTGCSTFTDDNVVARIGDAELTAEALSELVGAKGRVSADQTRRAIDTWLSERLPAAAEPTDEELLRHAARGSAETGWLCIQTISTLAVEDASDAVAALDNGAEFQDVLTEFSANPNEVAGAGRGGCVDRRTLASDLEAAVAAGPPAEADVTIINGLLSMFDEQSTYVATQQSQVGEAFIVVHPRPADTDDIPNLRQIAQTSPIPSDDIDVVVNPRYGQWRDGFGVVPLG